LGIIGAACLIAAALGVFTYGMHTYSYENQVIIEINCLITSYLQLIVSCHPDGTRPHQVRFARAHALPSTHKGQYSCKAHLMRTDPVRKTTHVETVAGSV